MIRVNLSSRLNPDFDLKEVFLRSSTVKSNVPPELSTSFIYDYLKIVLQFLRGDQKELQFPNLTSLEEDFLVKITQNKKYLLSSNLNRECLQVANQIMEVEEKKKNVYRWTHIYKDSIPKRLLVYKKIAPKEQLQDESCTKPSPMPALASEFKEMSLHDRQEVTSTFKITTLNTLLKFIKDRNQLTIEYPEMPLHEAEFLLNLIQTDNQKDSNVGFGFKSMYSKLHEAIENLKESHVLKFDILKTCDVLTSKLILKKEPKAKKSNCMTNNTRNDLNSPVSTTESKCSAKHSFKEFIVQHLTERFLKNSLKRFLDFIEDDSMASLEYKEVNMPESKFLESLLPICRAEKYDLFSPECEVLLKRILRASRRKQCAVQRSVGRLCKVTNLRSIVFFKTPSYDHGTQNTTADQSTRKLSKETKFINSTNKESILSFTDIKGELERLRPVKEIKPKCGVIDLKSVRHDVKEVKNLIPDSDVTDLKPVRSIAKEVTPKCSDVKNLTPDSVMTDLKPVRSFVKEGLPKCSEIKNLTPDSEVRDLKPERSTCKQVTTESSNIKNIKPDVKDLKRDLSTAKKGIFNAKDSKLDSQENKSDRVESKDHNKSQKSNSKDSSVLNNPLISFESAGSSRLDFKGEEPQPPRSPPPASRHARLLKALATPIADAGNAERMMVRMGWEGGALGARGEGLLEPVMPAIHISPGAGLGHVKQSVPTTSVAEFRVKLLRDILIFVQGTTEETTLKFPQAMTERDGSFLRHAVEGLNDRRVIGLSKTDEKDLIRRIVENISNNPRLYIGYRFSDDKTQLKIIKVTGPTFVPKPSNNKKKKSKRLQTAAVKNEIMTISEATVEDIEDLCPTRKAAERLAYKLKFLEKIKEFVKGVSREAEYEFDCVINTKHKMYIERNIMDVNRAVSSMRPNYSKMENDLFREIKMAAAGCYVSVTFESKKFKLHKKFSSKKQVNNIEDLPPPKSKDLKNTIIYLPKQHPDHNTKISGNESDDDDDDTNGDDKAPSNNNAETERRLHLDVSNDTNDYLNCDSVRKRSPSHDKDGKSEMNNNYVAVKDKNNVERTKECQGINKSKSLRKISSEIDGDCLKKSKFIKHVSIVSKSGTPISVESVKFVQNLILNSIDDSNDKICSPLLQCHGIQNGSLVYSCHSEESYKWLKDIMTIPSDIEIVDTDVFKMSFKINSFIDMEPDIVFRRLQLNNPELNTDCWVLLKEQKKDNYTKFFVKVDEHSFNFLIDNKCSLNMGIDKAQFSILWD